MKSLVPFDPLALEKLKPLNVSGQPDIIAELISDFLEKTPLRIQKIEKAALDENIEELKIVSHSLKSAAATLGLNQFSKCCYDIETQSQKRQIARLEIVLLPSLLRSAQGYLRKYLAD